MAERFDVRRVSKRMQTPVGRLTLIASATGLSAVLWEIERAGRVSLQVDAEEPDHAMLLEAERQLVEYFAGARRSFDLPLEPVGTAFQMSVWQALRTIPFGETRSYLQIAQQLGNPKAVRAVGAANGRNPLSIVTPCHRVIGASGELVGFAGGLDVKAKLLTLERQTVR